MAVKASANITLFHVIDIDSTTIYYLLQSSTANPPAKPTTDNPGGNWTTTEPTYTEGSTNTLYTVTKTKFSDGTFEYTPVSKSSSYEAAKNAYNKALNADVNANTALNTINNLEIGGKNILRKSKAFSNEGVSNTETGYLRSKGTVTTDQSIDDFTVVTCTPSSASILGEWLINGCKNGETYTLSFWVKGAGAPRCYFYGPSGYITCEKVTTQNGTGNSSDGNSDSGAGGVPVSNSEWQRVWVTWKLKDTGGTTDQKYVLIRNDNKVEVYVAGAKFERGNKPTDWTPAPEDVDEAILSVDTKHDYIIGTQTAATRFWTGVSNITTLKDGQEIVFWLPYATAYTNAGDRTVGVNMRVNSSTTKNAGTTIISFETGTSMNVVWLNLTLQGGNQTGWIPCYYGGTSRLTSHYGAGNAIRLVYRVNAKVGGEAATAQYTGWFADANYVDGNNYDRIRFNNAIKVKSAISAGQLIVSDDNGYFKLIGGSIFKLDKPILYCGTNKSAGATDSTNNFLSMPSVSIRNNTNSSWTATKDLTLYLVGIMDGNTFTVDSTTPFTTTIPTTEDGKYYISLGYMYSTYQIYLYPEHPIFKYINDQFKNIAQIAYEAQSNLDSYKEDVNVRFKDTITTSTFEKSNGQLRNEMISNYGINYILDSMGVFNDNSWTGDVESIDYHNAVGLHAIVINNNTISQKIRVKGGEYTLSFTYIKNEEYVDNDNAKLTVKFYDEIFEYTDSVNFKQTKNVFAIDDNIPEITIEISGNVDNLGIIYDLMLNDGTEIKKWQQNQNETVTDEVTIGRGITCKSSISDTTSYMNTDGFRVKSNSTNIEVMKATSVGGEFNELKSRAKTELNGLLILKFDDVIWLNGGE